MTTIAGARIRRVGDIELPPTRGGRRPAEAPGHGVRIYIAGVPPWTPDEDTR